MQTQPLLDTALIRSWIDAKLEPAAVEAVLKQMNLPEANVAAYLKEYRKERFASRRFNGFTCCAVGALLGFISCLLSVFNPIPELYNVILFGLTSVAILVICLGLYFLFE